jgi:hypothetical protein
MMRTAYDVPTQDRGPTLLRWSAVFGGLILGLALLMVLSALWFAMAFGSGVDVVEENLDWFVGLSAVFALFVGGLLAGYLSGVRGAGTGMLHGFTLWGLMLVVTLVVGVPSILGTLGLDRTVDTAATAGSLDIRDMAIWATFWTLLGGFAAAGLGGMIGGATTRDDSIPREAMVAPPVQPRTRVVDVPDAPVDDDVTVPHRHSTTG